MSIRTVSISPTEWGLILGGG